MYVIKVWKHNDMYYMLLGAQRENKTGTLLLYKSQDLYNWHFQGEITTNLKNSDLCGNAPITSNYQGKMYFSFHRKELKKTEKTFTMYTMSFML